MDRRLSENEISYLLDHLEKHYSGPGIRDYLVTGVSSLEEGAGTGNRNRSLYIPQSESPVDPDKVITIGKIPVLFPCSEKKEWYSRDGNMIRFHHDILKSAFFLLSGYQDYVNEEPDAHGRFPWKSSVQHSLGITGIPVVNYYFDVILEAFEELCLETGLDFKRKEMEGPVLFLSHDVDRIKKYSLRNTGYMGLRLLGLRPSSSGFARNIRAFFQYARGTLLMKKDPYWNFDRLMDLEKKLGIRSTWYFLEKTAADNSKYHFSDPGISGLIQKLESDGHEVGIHGTLESSEDQEEMTGAIRRLNEVCDRPVIGIRQHYLKYRFPLTPRLQSRAGLTYDATLGFAEHIGFRNSYAHPFRLYDFEHQKPFEIVQIPLAVMEVSLLEYMKVPHRQAIETIGPLVEEVTRFRGVFSLLWHNCQLDEEEYPGINRTYRELLEWITGRGFRSMTGQELAVSW